MSAIIVITIDITDKKEESERQLSYNKELSKKITKINGDKNIDQAGVPGQEIPVIIETLTDREKEVLKLISEGFTNNQIADLLKISHHTVKSHVINIFNKLGVNDRTQAAVIASRNKIV
ncbi:MAG: response regulator transcription factor [bacterium]|nr:response regulator transcription factor [bacterium]